MKAVVLVGHGGVPKDFPRELVREMKALERERKGGPMTDREQELETKIRTWPRTPESDPYMAGFTELANALRAEVAPHALYVAYNEFCAPSLDDAIDQAARDGATQLSVTTSMITPGGYHASEEIPAILAAARERHPSLSIVYAWPIPLAAVAELFAAHLEL